ncbi:restriction endonuclease subunit S [Pseudobutyrivibrio sp.]|uniref:restriction endonuclease subunit S n=1 Tax=Pseudobutyrivibrio sp. TaxID=2014367 RepID=UPI0025DFBD07|nr:restriction endonuclease subunit S [Pseudobutyrivibrio sp.]
MGYKPKVRLNGFTNDWEQRKLGDIADVTKLAGFEFTEHVVYSDEGNIIALRGLNIKNGQLVLDDVKYIDGSNFAKLNRSKLFIDDIMFTYVGTVGEVAIIKENDRFYLAPNVSRIRVQSNDSPKFISHYMRTDSFYRHVIFPLIATSSQPALSMENIRKFEICLPKNRDEQDKLSEFFDGIDNLITLHQRKCEETKELKKYMLHKMFPKNSEKKPEIRFSGFTGDWEQRKFSSVFEGLQNNTLSRAELNYESGTIKNVHYGDVLIKFGDYIDASETELPYISDDTKADKFKNSFLQDGDIIIADTAEDDTVGKCTEIQGSKGLKLLSGLHTIACRPKEKYGPMFLGYYINSPAYHNQLKPLMQGIKVTSISKSALQDTDMIMPKSIDEQIKIGEYFSNLDNLITLHQRKCDETKELKKYMLQNMFPQN